MRCAMWRRLQAMNDRLAVLGTKAFGSMITFWLFFFWGILTLLPWVPGGVKQFALLVSSAFIQLAALPLISVGAAVLNRSTERRAKQDHESLKQDLALQRQEFQIQKDEMAKLDRIESKVDQVLKELRPPRNP